MAFEIEGKLHKKFPVESKSDTFQTREFVIEIQDGAYPQFIKFQLVQDRCALVDPIPEGEPIKVSFDLRGREWQGKYFTNLNAWRIERSGSAAPPPAASTKSSPANSTVAFPATTDEPPAFGYDSDLPF